MNGIIQKAISYLASLWETVKLTARWFAGRFNNITAQHLIAFSGLLLSFISIKIAYEIYTKDDTRRRTDAI